jgi:4-amino-4-deoxy-L-arabinose transferase-like glycosyltransferase
MNSRDSEYHHLTALLLLSVVALGSALWASETMVFSPDGMRYMLTAQEIILHNEARIPIVWWETSLERLDARNTILMTEQPPGFPFLLSVMNIFPGDMVSHGRSIAVFSHLASVLFTYLISIRFTSLTNSMMVALSSAVAYPMLLSTHVISSEASFLAMCMGSLYFLVLSRNSSNFKACLMISGTFASLAISIRFAGVYLVPLITLEVLRLWYIDSAYRKKLSIYFAFLLPVLTFSALMLRNYLYSGSVRGFKQPLPDRTITEGVVGTIEMLFRQFAIYNHKVMFLLLLAIFLMIVVALYQFLTNNECKNDAVKMVRKGLDICLTALLGYVALVCLIMYTNQPQFELRFVMPATPLVFLIFAMLIHFALPSCGRQKTNKRFLFVSLLGIMVIANCLIVYRNTDAFSSAKDDSQAFLQTGALEWLSDNPQTGLIATNNAFRVAFYGGGRPVLRIPNKEWNPKYTIPDNIAERMEELGSKYLMVFPKSDGLTSEIYGELLSQLAEYPDSYGPFTKVAQGSHMAVYKLRL